MFRHHVGQDGHGIFGVVPDVSSHHESSVGCGVVAIPAELAGELDHSPGVADRRQCGFDV